MSKWEYIEILSKDIARCMSVPPVCESGPLRGGMEVRARHVSEAIKACKCSELSELSKVNSKVKREKRGEQP